MKIKVLFFFLFTFLMIVSIPSIVAGSEKLILKIGIINLNYPYTHSDYHKDGSPAGFDVESMQWIANDLGYQILFVPLTKIELIPKLLAKEIDIAYSGIMITEELKQKVDFSDVYWTIKQVVIAKENGNINIENFNAGQYLTGVLKSSNASKWLKNNFINTGILPQEKLLHFNSYPEIVNGLSEGKIQVAVINESFLLQKENDIPLEIIGVMYTEEYAIAIRKEDVELKNLLNGGLKKLMQSTKWEELIKKYEM